MKRYVMGFLITMVVSALGTPSVLAATTDQTQFILPIVPLECTIETIATGAGPVDTITCPEPEQPTPVPGTESPVTAAPTSTRYLKILMEIMGESPIWVLNNPIQTPDNKRFGVRIDYPRPMPSPDYITPLYPPIVLILLACLAVGLYKAHQRADGRDKT